MRHSIHRALFERRLLHPLARLLPGLLLAAASCSIPDDRPAQPDMTRASVGTAAVSAEAAVAAAVQQPAVGGWPAAAFDGSQYLVVWEDLRTGRSMLYGARVSADGTALDPSGIPLLDDDRAPRAHAYRPAVAFDGESFLVVSLIGNQIYGVRVSPAGEVLDPVGFAITNPASSRANGQPALVFDGEQYLVTWAGGWTPDRYDGAIYWARVKPDGTVLDPHGVRGYELGIDSTPVGVSFDGTSYLLSWSDGDAETQDIALFAARVRPDGTRLDAVARRVSPSGGRVAARVSPVGGFDGTNHVILWMFIQGVDYTDYQIMVTRVTPQGTVLDPDGIVAGTERVETSDVHRLDMSSGDGRSVVTWSMDYGGEGGPSAHGISVAQVTADGAASTHPASGFRAGLEATLLGHQAGGLLLWRAGSDLYADYPHIIGARLDAAGTPVSGGEVVPASTASHQDVLGVASDGQTFFVVWRDTRDLAAEGRALYGARITADGTQLDADGILLHEGPTDVAGVVFDGANFLAIWASDTGGEGEGAVFYAVRVSPSGELLDTTPLALPLGEHVPAAASDGAHTLVVGESKESSSDVVAAVLVDQDGAVASEVVSIVNADRGDVAYARAVSFDGAGYLVAWSDGAQVLGQRVSADGALVGGQIPIASGEAISRVTVGAGGGNHLVVWQDRDGLFATRVSPDGQVLDPQGHLIESSTTTEASVAFEGERFVVAWVAPSITGGASSFDVRGAELNPAGEVLRKFVISAEQEHEGIPFVAAGAAAGQVLAAYTRFVPGAPDDARRARARLLVSEADPDARPDAGPPGPAPDAGASPVDPLPGDGGGCGCTLGAAQPTPAAPLLLLGGVIALWLVRRRSAR